MYFRTYATVTAHDPEKIARSLDQVYDLTADDAEPGEPDAIWQAYDFFERLWDKYFRLLH